MSFAYTEYKYNNTANPNGKAGEQLVKQLRGKIKKLPGIYKICELGCGNGYFSDMLATLGYEIVGVDASASGIQQAQKACKRNCAFVQSKINSSLSKEVGTNFDLVVAVEVIEHLYRPSDLIEAAASLLRPEGYFPLTTPYHGYLKNLILALSGRMDNHFNPLWNGGHIKFFSVKTLKRLAALHNFQEIKFEFFGRFPWIWKSMICLAKKRGKGRG